MDFPAASLPTAPSFGVISSRISPRTLGTPISVGLYSLALGGGDRGGRAYGLSLAEDPGAGLGGPDSHLWMAA